jgi:TolB protein
VKKALLIALVVLVAALGPSAPTAAEPQAQPEEQQTPGREITVELPTEYQRARLRLAAPDPEGTELLSPENQTAAQELARVLRDDLAVSGVFEVQGPEQLAILELTGDQFLDFQMYRSLANEVLVETSVQEEEGRLILEGRVFSLDSGRSVLGKRYGADTSLARRIAHTFADEIVRFFTGRRGIAMTAIAFHSDRGDRLGREVYLMDYDGYNQRAITAHETLSMSPDWSPRGDAISYVSYLNGNPGIFLVNLNNGQKTPVVDHGDFNSSPAFSPDGRKIAFARSVGGGNTEIFLANRDGSELHQLTRSRGIDTNPAWSPTGREIAFSSSRSGSPQIYVMSAEGTDLRRITFAGRYNDGAAWSPDGARVAHSSRRDDGTFNIAITDLVTLETRFLTEGVTGSHESPSFSPDGRKIVFASTITSRRGTESQIQVMDLDGGNWRQLTREGNNYSPSWSGHLE